MPPDAPPTRDAEPDAHLRALLRDQDVPCPGCGYNLRGSQAMVCPECGRPFTAAELLNPKPRVSAAWLTMVVCYAAALPWSVWYMWQRLVFRRQLVYGEESYLPGSVGAYPEATFTNPRFVMSYGWWLSVPFVLALLVVFRRRISAWPAWLRWTLAAASVVMVLLAYRRWAFWYTALSEDWPEFWWLPRAGG